MRCLLADEPRLKFTVSELIVDSESATYSIPVDNLVKFGFESESSSIEVVEPERIDYSLNGNRILLNGLLPGASVRLYKIDGVCVFDEVNHQTDGKMEIAVSNFAPGIYLLNINRTTTKIAIR